MKGLRRSVSALLILAIWGTITVGGLLIQLHGPQDLMESVGRGIAFPILAASVFLLFVTRGMGRKDIGFCRPKPLRSLLLLWFPVALLIGFGYIALYMGVPSTERLLLLAFNTLLVGFSEEVMFRGILLSGFRAAMSLRSAVVVSTLLFGLVHSMNVLITGDLVTSIVQSCAAVLTGTMLVAIRLRTGSLWPCIIIHMLWDLLMFTIASNQPAPGTGPSGGIAIQFLPLLIVLPNFIYGVILMRRLR